MKFKLNLIVPTAMQLLLNSPLLMPAQASILQENNRWVIDKEHSRVSFHIKHMLVSQVSGEFHNVSGNIIYDGRHLERAIVEAEIAPESVDTHIPKRDNHLRSKKFFDVLHYPTISFRSQKIRVDKNGAFKILGVLSMHGVTEQIVLNAGPLQQKFDIVPKLSTTATAELNRKEFGISMGLVDHGGTMIGDNVEIQLEIELQPNK
jgi:polyisoprenoid-binding protein YceI